MTIETYGAGERLSGAASLLAEGCRSHLVLLPVPTTKDKKTVTGTDIALSEVLVNLSGGSTLVGYDLPSELCAGASERKARVIDLSLDEKFLTDNAYLTALAAISYIMMSSKREIGEISFGIIGYGRISKQLLRLLLFFGARVRVYTGKEESALALAALGVDATLGYTPSLSEADILINTAPTDLSYILSSPPPAGVRIIELASGENFGGSPRVERLPSLPERFYPRSAAASYARAVKRLL